MDPETLAKLDEILTATQETNTRLIELYTVNDSIFNINTEILIRMNTQITLQNDLIFLQNGILIALSFISGFCMYWLFKKNFYSFGTDLK